MPMSFVLGLFVGAAVGLVVAGLLGAAARESDPILKSRQKLR